MSLGFLPGLRVPRRLIVVALLAGSWIVSAKHADDARPAPLRHRGPLATAAAVGDDQRGAPPRGQALGPDARVPQNLRSDEFYRGRPWRGTPGVVERVTDLMAREAAQPRTRPLRMARELDGPKDPKLENPDAPSLSRWPGVDAALASIRLFGPVNPQAVSTSWTGIHASESGYVPPDAIGAVGPTQVMVLANGKFKVFDKAGNLSSLNVTDSTFFTSVRGTSSVSDPHVRYDRLSGRWFITEINVANNSNRILIAVSSGSTITDSSSFTFFQFQHDAVGTTPNADTNGFADYDTLGVDANALYIGVNEFSSGTGSFIGTSGYVVNKASLLTGTLTVTAFRGLASGSGTGPYTPQGVDNDDLSATEGYFIGVDNATFSTLMVRRVTTPGGTPAISGNISLTVPTTYYPVFGQVAQGSTRNLDAIDDRLFAAMMRKNTSTSVSSLWTAHNIRVNSSGVSSSSGDRNATRWYQIDSLTTTPVLTQSGTLFDTGTSNPKGYWMGSVATNGQGHMAIVASFAGAADYAGVAVSGRLAGDTVGATQSPTVVVTGTGAYNDWTTVAQAARYRWGDYSQVVVDPTDNQTMWAFADYAYGTSTNDAWGVRAVKLLAPPPATPSSASPSAVGTGVSSTNVTVTGTPSSGSGFFDPGSEFTSRISASVSGGVTVNSVTFVNATTLTLNVSTVGATSGAQNITITNPDGQQATGAGVLTVGPTVTSVSPSSGWTGGGTTLTITGSNFVVGATSVTIGGVAATGVAVPSTTSLTALTPAHAAGTVTVSVTTAVGTGSATNAYSYFVSLFTDDPLQAGITTVKAVHITELRVYVDTLRRRYGLSAYAWTDATLVAGTTTIKAAHVAELRTALSAAYVAAGLAPPTFTGTITASSTLITAAQITEIRNAIVAIY